jgi:hypothetical protein
MNHDSNSPYSGHEELSMLLPWYANGTLEGEELEKVRQHLGVCLTCRKELGGLEMLAKGFQQSPALGISPSPSFGRLMAQIQAQDKVQAQVQAPKVTAKRPSKSWLNRTTEWLSDWTLNSQTVAVFATLVLALFVPFLFNGKWSNTGNDYHTLAASGEMNRFQSGDVRVVFDSKVTEGEMAKLLSAVEGRIVDGPSELGVYTIRVGAGKAPSQSVEHVISRLRQDKGVLLAEPALSPADGAKTGG